MPSRNKTLQVGDEQITLEPFSGRKAIRVIKTIEHITKGVPEILDAWADFTRQYEEKNVTVMDRATARHFYRPNVLYMDTPLMDEDGKTPLEDKDGNVLVQRVPKLEDGKPVMGPDPLGHMTEEDWAASGNKLRLPKAPSREEQIAAIFPKALTLAEEEVKRLLAVLAMPNADLKRAARAGDLDVKVNERAEELIEAPMTDLVELVVAAGEMVDEQVTSKIEALGDRLPNALRLFGLNPESLKRSGASKSESSKASANSSTDSPPPTDGAKDESSTEPSGDALSASAN